MTSEFSNVKCEILGALRQKRAEQVGVIGEEIWQKLIDQTKARVRKLPPRALKHYESSRAREAVTNTASLDIQYTRAEILGSAVRHLVWQNHRSDFYEEVFGYNSSSRDLVIKLWGNVVHDIFMQEDGEGIRITDDEISVSRDFMNRYLLNFMARNPVRDKEAGGNLYRRAFLCKTAIQEGLWPVEDDGRYEFDIPIFYSLLADRYLVSEADYSDKSPLKDIYDIGYIDIGLSPQVILQRLEDDGCFDPRKLPKIDLLFSIIAQRILESCKREENFTVFIDGIAARGGVAMARAVLREVKKDYSKARAVMVSRESGIKHSAKWNVLKEANKALRERDLIDCYPNRPVVISEEIYAKALADPDNFSRIIATETGVVDWMKTTFAGSKDDKTQLVLERVLDLDPSAAASVMIIADILGYPRAKAVKLAGVVWYTRGLQECLDASKSLDAHSERRGRESIWVKEGADVEFDVLMLSINKVLGTVLDLSGRDKKLMKRYLAMMGAACMGDLQSRQVTADSPQGDYDKAMEVLDIALRWYVEHMGEKTGLIQAGQEAACFLAAIHRNFINALEDVDSDNKVHAQNKDLMKGILSYFWQAALGLSDVLITPQEKDDIREAFRVARQARKENRELSLDELPLFGRVAATGARNIQNVALALEPRVKVCYTDALNYLDMVGESLPDRWCRDKRNERNLAVLASMVDRKLERFNKYTHPTK